jgi:hypothetical protein
MQFMMSLYLHSKVEVEVNIWPLDSTRNKIEEFQNIFWKQLRTKCAVIESDPACYPDNFYGITIRREYTGEMVNGCNMIKFVVEVNKPYAIGFGLVKKGWIYTKKELETANLRILRTYQC